MSDEHRGPSHDLPEYVPNVRTRARVYRTGAWWTWEHHCAWKNHLTNGYPEDSQPVAFARALKHMEGCW